jgi:hypothetical protein
MHVKEIVWEAMEWMHLLQDRDQWRSLRNMVSIKGVEFADLLSD